MPSPSCRVVRTAEPQPPAHRPHPLQAHLDPTPLFSFPLLPFAQVVRMTKQEMAALRSAMPSPNKHKGHRMTNEMGFKTGEAHRCGWILFGSVGVICRVHAYTWRTTLA